MSLASLAAYGDEADSDEAAPASNPNPSSTKVELSKGSNGSKSASSLAALGTYGEGTDSHPTPLKSETEQEVQNALPAEVAMQIDEGPQEPVLPPSPVRVPRPSRSSIAHLLPQLPPNATEQADPILQKKVARFFEALRAGHSVNDQLRSSKQFNNPDILEKLITFWELDEIGSNYPPALFDPHGYDDGDFYTALAERQAGALPAAEKGRTQIDFTPAATTAAAAAPVVPATAGSAASAAGDAGKRGGSKWDVKEAPQPAKGQKAEPPPAPVAKPAPAVPGEEPSKYRQYVNEQKRKAEMAAALGKK